jgi:hypothetical protein
VERKVRLMTVARKDGEEEEFVCKFKIEGRAGKLV